MSPFTAMPVAAGQRCSCRREQKELRHLDNVGETATDSLEDV
jgi:hypothetical protein